MSETIEEYEDLMLLWESLNYLPESTSPIQVRVFIGGFDSIQITPFKGAVFDQNFDCEKFEFDYISISDIKKVHWSPNDLVDWLLGCHVHFILSHVHQGLEPLQWNLVELQEQLKRLRHHKGFPNGDSLGCPIFTQDKYNYISSVPSLTNPTLKIDIIDDQSDEILSGAVDTFINANDEGCGWILKAPFTTNCQFIRFCKDKATIFRYINIATKKFLYILPYVMLQACMANRKEYKVVVINQKALYVANDNKKSGKSFSQFPHTELLKFAENAVIALKFNCPSAITDGLVRVDIFKTLNNGFVVNEFESLEACYYNKKDSQFSTEAEVSTFLRETYWKNKLEEFITIKK
jgi:hypothetical protein